MNAALGVLERARSESVYSGHVAVITAMADLDKALRAGDGEAGTAAGVLVTVVAEHVGEDAARYVRGNEGES